MAIMMTLMTAMCAAHKIHYLIIICFWVFTLGFSMWKVVKWWIMGKSLARAYKGKRLKPYIDSKKEQALGRIKRDAGLEGVDRGYMTKKEAEDFHQGRDPESFGTDGVTREEF